MLLVYDDNGMITQAIADVMTDATLDLYKAQGYDKCFIREGNLPNIMQYYVIETADGPKAVERPELNLVLDKPVIKADGIEQATITGVPAEASILLHDGVTSTQFVADGSPVEVVAEHPGKYSLYVQSWPYMPHTIEVIAQ